MINVSFPQGSLDSVADLQGHEHAIVRSWLGATQHFTARCSNDDVMHTTIPAAR